MKTKEQKRKEAQQRQEAYDQLTFKEKMARLPEQGCDRQKAKLLKQEARRLNDPVAEAAVVMEERKQKRKAKDRRVEKAKGKAA